MTCWHRSPYFKVCGLWVRLLEIVFRGLESWYTVEDIDCGVEPVLAVSTGFVIAGTHEHIAGYCYNWILHARYSCEYTSASGALTDSPKYEEAPGLVEAEEKW